MPTYSYRCDCGARFDRVLPVRLYASPQTCECGRVAVKQLSRPMVIIPGEIRFRSPVDGREITSKQGWREDMARHNCMEYDPGMKQDYLRRREESDTTLDNSIDCAVDATIESFPARKRELLEQELRAGADLDTQRLTATET